MRTNRFLAILAVACPVAFGEPAAPSASGAQPVPLSRVIDYEPAWSPDGTLILRNTSRSSAKTNDPDTFELFTMRPDGSDVRQLTRGGIATYASWSPDGSRLVFRKQLADGNSEIFVMVADGTDLTNLTRHPAFDGWPAWSRDGKRIVFARESGEYAGIHVMNADGSGVRLVSTLPGRCTNPRWSPVADRILFSRRAERQIRLYTVDIEP